MAPVASLFALALAAGIAVEATPLNAAHARPDVANLLSTHHSRALKNFKNRYYGTSHGLTPPPVLNTKRAPTLPAGWTYQGCMDESWNQRLLQGSGYSSSSLTTLQCLTSCQNSGFIYGGIEYGDECYCGNSLVGSGGTVSSDSTCNTPCAGDTSNTCGAAWFLSVYKFDNSSLVATANAANSCAPVAATATQAKTTPVTTAATQTTATTTKTTTNAAATPTHTDLSDHSEWYSLGCAVDPSGSNRLLTGYAQQYWTGMTTDECLSTCEAKGFSFAGTEYGQECYCGSTVPASITYTDGACTFPCSGDASDTCGASYYMELYELISAGANCTASSTTVAAATRTAVNLIATGTNSAAVPALTESATIASDHSVWAHHMVGNTYPYTQSNWASDISTAMAAGIDGFALNMGSDSWQPDRINDAYTAAQAAGSSFKLFLSLDMTVMSCSSSNDAATLVSLVQRWAAHPNQALHNGKVLVSTFAGSDCTFGQGSNNGWKTLFFDKLTAAGVNIFFVPSVFSDPSTFSSYAWMDGELNWNSGWPTGSTDLTTASDTQYMTALGSKEYMPAISPFFYTHFGANSWNKNWLYRGDDWLYCTRWEQVIAMRNSVKMTEILTWNDYGESSYIGSLQGAMPTGSEVWVNGFDHQGLNVLTKYYSTAFKTGSYPAITQDSITMWSRPHPYAATATSDSVGRPTGWNWTEDYLWAVVLVSQASTVTLTSGSSSQTFSVPAGLSKLKIASQTGGIGGSITRNGQTTASYTSSGFTYTNTPSTYNYNYFVGSSS